MSERLDNFNQPSNQSPNPLAEQWENMASDGGSSNRYVERGGDDGGRFYVGTPEKTNGTIAEQPEKLGQETKDKAASEISFSPIGENEMSLIADLEKKLYSAETLQYGDGHYLRSLLSEPGNERFSFIIHDRTKGEQQPVGYCIACYTEPRSNLGYEGKAVEVVDFGIVPEGRGMGKAALMALWELLNRTEADGVGLIEMEARRDTSYQIFSSRIMQNMLAKRGYIVTDHGVSDDGWADGDVTYLVSLRKTTGHQTNN
jgi:hypothetical protein